MSLETAPRLQVAKKIVIFGGGHGGPLMGDSILHAGAQADIVVSMGDDGGLTGIRRKKAFGSKVPHGDAVKAAKAIVSLEGRESPSYRQFKKLLAPRDPREGSLGQHVLEEFFDEEKGYEPLHELMREGFNLDLSGRLLPATTDPAEIHFKTFKGNVFEGEHHFDEQSMSKDMVESMWLKPSFEASTLRHVARPLIDKVRAFPHAMDAVSEADIVILAPGSLHASVLSSAHPEGMREALAQAGEVWYVTNPVSTRNETNDFLPKDFLDVIWRNTGVVPNLLVPEWSRRDFEDYYPDVYLNYQDSDQRFLGWKDDLLNDLPDEVQVYKHDATVVTEDHEVEFDPEKLGVALKDVIKGAGARVTLQEPQRERIVIGNA